MVEATQSYKERMREARAAASARRQAEKAEWRRGKMALSDDQGIAGIVAWLSLTLVRPLAGISAPYGQHHGDKRNLAPVTRDVWEGLFALGVGERQIVDQHVLQMIAANYQALTPEFLASQQAQ